MGFLSRSGPGVAMKALMGDACEELCQFLCTMLQQEEIDLVRTRCLAGVDAALLSCVYKVLRVHLVA